MMCMNNESRVKLELVIEGAVDGGTLEKHSAQKGRLWLLVSTLGFLC